MVEFIKWFEKENPGVTYKLRQNPILGCYIQQNEKRTIYFVEWYTTVHLGANNKLSGGLEVERSDIAEG